MIQSSQALLDPILDRVHRGHCWIKTPDGPRRIDEPLTPHHVTRHMTGKAAFGVCPLAPGGSTVRLALLDFDSHQGETPAEDMAEVVSGLMAKCRALGLSPIPFRSSGGSGAHVFFLWEDPQDAYSVRQRLTALLNLCNLTPGTGGVAKGEVEVFPKQDSVPVDGFGSMFILPLAGKSARLDASAAREIPVRLAHRWEWPLSDPVPLLQKPERTTPPLPAGADHEEVGRLLAQIPNDAESLDYDQWRDAVFAVHHATGGSDEGLALAHVFSARSPKYDPAFLDERVWPYIDSGRDNPVTLATLRYIARQHEDPAGDFEDLGPLQEDPVDAPSAVLSDRFRVVDEAEVLLRPRPRWLVKGIVPEADLVVLYGQSTAGKSFVALDMFACVARGVPWRGLRTRQARVIYLAAEGQGGFRNRLEAYHQHHTTPTGLRLVLDAPNFLKADAKLLGEQIQAAGGTDVLVVDTLAQVASGGDENSAEDMGKVLLSCRHLRRLTGALIVLIHHAGKDLTRGARGWSGLKAAADAEIEVNRVDNDRWIKVSKSKDGEDGAEYPFRLLPVTLGLDEEGDEVTSCVVEHLEQVLNGRAHEPKGRVERQVWRMAHDLTELGDDAVPVDVLITESARKLPHDSTTGRDRRRESAKKAITSLVEAGFLSLEDNQIQVLGPEPTPGNS